MIPILYEATELNFTSNGVCRLAEATECHVVEERNGEYELTLTYPITGKYYDQIQEGMYIAATHDDKGDRQPFRIYRRSAPFNGLVQFFAHHISYMLNNIVLNPITATSAADAFDQMETDTVTTNPFTMWTDVTTAGDFDNETPASIRSALGGKRGSILDVYGGEYEWNMFAVKLHAHRGLDSDATIRYGKNLTDLTQTIDAGGLYNAIVPYWFGTVDDEDVLVTLPENYVAADGVTNPVMVVMDFSSEFQDKPTEAQLRSKASSYLSSNRPWVPSENIKISFVQLWQTEEYKDVAVLQRLSLCDRVSVYYPALGITAEGVKIIKTNYNVLLDRYDEMELGDARSSFADTLINPIEDAIEVATQNLASKAYMQKAIDHATELITGGLGGHIIFLYDANGKPTDMLVMDTESVTTAQHVLRINVNGIGFSSTGVNGPYTSAWTLDGQFVADFITAGTMLANRIKGGTLSLGGVDNGNGVLHVYDASGNLIGKWNKDGIDVTGIVRAIASYNYADPWANSWTSVKTETAYFRQSEIDFYLDDVNREKAGVSYPEIHEYVAVIDAITGAWSSGYDRMQGREPRRESANWADSYGLNIAARDTFRLQVAQELASGSTKGVFLAKWDKDNNRYYVWLGGPIGGSVTELGGRVNITDKLVLKWLFIDYPNNTYDNPYSNGAYGFFTGRTGVLAGDITIRGSSLSLFADGDIWIGTRDSSVSSYQAYGCEINCKDFHIKYPSSSGSARINYRDIQVVSSSSRRYKHDIVAIADETLDPHKLYDLEVKQFEYNDDVPVQYEDMRDQTLPGFIAEEVAEIYPSAVIHNQDGDIESWDERRIIPGMLALIQEQKKQIDDLQARLEKLENLVNTLM